MDLNRPYWNMEVEPKLNTPEMRELQNEKLLRNMRAIYDRIPLVRKRMDEAGVGVEDIRSLDDLEKIPIYGQPQMRELLMEVGFDMKKILHMLMGDMADDVYVMAATSGTTGIPTPYPVVRSGLPLMREMNNRILWRCGVRPGHKIVLAFGLSMFLAGSPTLLALEEFPGITIIPVGAEAGTERIINFTRLFGGDVLMCTPSLALHLIERAPEIMGDSVKALGIKIHAIGLARQQTTLRLLAETTGGRCFEATDAAALGDVYAEIDRLERSVTEGRLYTQYRELYLYAMLPGLGLVLLEIVLASTRFRTLP
jgi:phenylacetate-CoA ligase